MSGGVPFGLNQSIQRYSHEGTTSEGREVTIIKDESPTRIDEVSDILIYIGWAKLGSDINLPVWKIKRIFKNNTVWQQEYADGNEFFDNIWSNRSALNYL